MPWPPLTVLGPHGNLEAADASWLMENVYILQAGRDDVRGSINTQCSATATRQTTSVAKRKSQCAERG